MKLLSLTLSSVFVSAGQDMSYSPWRLLMLNWWVLVLWSVFIVWCPPVLPLEGLEGSRSHQLITQLCPVEPLQCQFTATQCTLAAMHVKSLDSITATDLSLCMSLKHMAYLTSYVMWIPRYNLKCVWSNCVQPLIILHSCYSLNEDSSFFQRVFIPLKYMIWGIGLVRIKAKKFFFKSITLQDSTTVRYWSLIGMLLGRRCMCLLMPSQ